MLKKKSSIYVLSRTSLKNPFHCNPPHIFQEFHLWGMCVTLGTYSINKLFNTLTDFGGKHERRKLKITSQHTFYSWEISSEHEHS